VSVEISTEDLDQIERDWQELTNIKQFLRENRQALHLYEQYRILQELAR